MGGRTLDQFYSRQQARGKKSEGVKGAPPQQPGREKESDEKQVRPTR